MAPSRTLTTTALSILLVPALAAAQPRGVPPAFGGLWEVKIKSTHFGSGGAKTVANVTALLEIVQPVAAEGKGLSIGTFPAAFGTVLFPATSGNFFFDYLVTTAPGATLTATFKANATTGEVKSFKGNLTLDVFEDGGGVVVAAVKGKFLGASPISNSIFSADFEAGIGGYTETDFDGAPAATLWHAEGFCAAATAIPPGMGAGAAAYNRGDEGAPVYNFDTGATNEGALQSPAVAVPTGTKGLVLSFDTLRVGEEGATFDQSFVEAREVGDLGWAPLAQLINQVGCGDDPDAITLGFGKNTISSLVGSSFEHRFRFDSIDDVSNNGLGWYVDNVEILAFP
ncbi:MAG: hypothetical protein L0323_21925 [Planctomycetes bacterium]|nr:hypothetical protein [Planctomycetota bacterium]